MATKTLKYVSSETSGQNIETVTMLPFTQIS